MLPLGLLAQKTAVERLFEKYAQQKGITSIHISGKLLSLAGKFDSDVPATGEMLSNLDGIRILSVDPDSVQ